MQGDNFLNLFKAKITSVEMMTDRGFDVGQDVYYLEPQRILDYFQKKGIPQTIDQVRRVSFADFVVALRADARYQKDEKLFREERLSTIYIKGNIRALIYFVGDSRTKVKAGKSDSSIFTNLLYERGCQVGVMISSGALTPEAQADLAGLKTIFVQFFTDINLCYNITKHSSVHKHVLLADVDDKEKAREEIIAWIRSNNLSSITQLPQMSTLDPISRYYGFVPGDVIKIYRVEPFSSVICPEVLAYRQIVRGKLTK